ncbi:hypothetical protein AX15_006110 [Amanita polypyramis BW_CC]|nr:hypothetical protein AX15_006110 [Amanita polypyramis BW_CC]
MDLLSDHAPDSKPSPKPPVVRGARACTVCRAAKMKCVGAEDGQKPCQRCKRANVECKFEKHRRGRKPGSKLSEASKMLRRLEKGLNTAKLKSQSTEASMPISYPSDRNGHHDFKYPPRPGETGYTTTSNPYTSNGLPPLSNISGYHSAIALDGPSNGSRSLDMGDDDDDDDDDPDKNEQPLFPAKLISKENQRNSFFRTILNPDDGPSTQDSPSHRGHSRTPPHIRIAPIPHGLNDPITAGIITERDAHTLFDAIFLRLNPYINLFDPALHTVAYVRSKCPFLFTTLIMAGCKFFGRGDFRACQKLANDFAIRAFAEGWKRVEVVQAFACLTYWRDYDDKRTWTYIGYACRMAVELDLNCYVPVPPANETEYQKLERRNRERTYLVLFVHDRSLSTQTGRHWMLPEDDLIRHANSWHKEGGGPVRPEDVVIGAFVELRRIAAETTDVFNSLRSPSAGSHTDMNYEALLCSCNTKLNQWSDTWQREMDLAGGEKFHTSFLSFFKLYVRLFLNSFGIQAAMSPGSRQSPSRQTLLTCCSSALDSLRIISEDFASVSVLRYTQDSIMVMSAYSAVFLLRLLRNPVTYAHLNESISHEIYDLINRTADAYHDASSPASTSAAYYHARFLRSLVAEEVVKLRRAEKRKENGMSIDPRLQAPPNSHVSAQNATSQIYNHQVQQTPDHSFSFNSFPLNSHSYVQHNAYAPDSPTRNGSLPGNPHGTTIPFSYHMGLLPAAPHNASAEDADYWKNMFLELGYGSGDPNATNMDRTIPYSVENGHSQQRYHGQVQYHQMPNYGH